MTNDKHSKRGQELIRKYQEGTATPEERRVVEEWYAQLASRQEKVPQRPLERIGESVWQSLEQQIKPKRRLRFLPYAAAAVLLAFLGIGYWVIGDRWSTIPAAEVAPGTNRATLTLADGRTITLDEAQEGIIINDEDITYNDGSALGLSPAGGGRGRSDDVNDLVLTTPKGGTYQLTLPDGSKVWLNAGSTLKYPSRFSGEERVVFLEGEAYFDIESISLRSSGDMQGDEKEKKLSAFASLRENKIPFKVISPGQTVEVLGTEFNISAYENETETKTTLVDGAVEIVNLKSKIVNKLKPGDQAITREAATEIQQVETDQFTAWRDGLFHFSEDLESIMQQVGRWYDIDVVFKDDALKKQQLFASVFRNQPLDAVLKILEETSDAKFNVETKGTERRVVVMR